MNILFISLGDQIDYQCDCLFHGLFSLSDVDIYILNEHYHMFDNNNDDMLLKQYGMGFTITNCIPSARKHVHQLQVVENNIRDKFYDVIIYGSIWRCDVLLDVVLEHYNRNRIIFIDGEDQDFGWRLIPRIKQKVKLPYWYTKWHNNAIELSLKGLYFKRELREKDRKYFLPISFAIPLEKIVDQISEKQIRVATIIPGKLDTYIYKNEGDYYKGYQIAEFGVTFKKAGWDCMRHYEILANGCIPYFPNLQNCPLTTMTFFPKNIVLETNRFYEKGIKSDGLYHYYLAWLLDYTREYLTTAELAKYVLSFIL